MSARQSIVVTIDGPAGAGKSTVAKELARALGYRLLDTGAIYRSVALLSLEAGVDWEDATGLTAICRDMDIQFRFEDETNHVLIGGRDVTEAIRKPEISRGASHVSAHPDVRGELLELQRRLGRDGGVVVEGRDTGTVVFPGARAKFFLTASSAVRARRRHAEFEARGTPGDLAAIQAEIEERDRRDRERAVAPLVQADDAVLEDSSERSAAQVVASMLEIVRKREQIDD